MDSYDQMMRLWRFQQESWQVTENGAQQTNRQREKMPECLGSIWKMARFWMGT